jgi:hypothetical protein
MRKETTRVNLDPDQMAWVKELAKHRRCPVSQVIRTLVAEAMQKDKEEGV